MIIRRFRVLNSRLLLYLQDQITGLENDLDALEAEHVSPVRTDVHNGSFRQDVVPKRKALLKKILAKVKEYSEYNAT